MGLAGQGCLKTGVQFADVVLELPDALFQVALLLGFNHSNKYIMSSQLCMPSSSRAKNRSGYCRIGLIFPKLQNCLSALLQLINNKVFNQQRCVNLDPRTSQYPSNIHEKTSTFLHDIIKYFQHSLVEKSSFQFPTPSSWGDKKDCIMFRRANLFYIIDSFNKYYRFAHRQRIGRSTMLVKGEINCPDCREPITEDFFRRHIRNCTKYQGIALKQVNRLPRLSPLQLKLLMTEMDICREILESKLFDSLGEQVEVIRAPEPEKKIVADVDINSIDYDSQGIVSCGKCSKKMYALYDTNMFTYVEPCFHLFCLACLNKYIDDEFVNSCGNLSCPQKGGCGQTLEQPQIRQLLGNKKFEEIQNKALRKMMNIIQCAKCKTEYQYASGNPKDAPAKDANGKVLTQEDKKHYALNRFMCPKPNCKTEQCKQCKAIPFHIGLSCKDSKNKALMMKCRYCLEPITEKNKSDSPFQALFDICNAKQCQEAAAEACTKMLPCGHPCCGFKGEIKCLPCLNESCRKDFPQLNDQTGEDYCNVCFVESLTCAPCVRSECGHIFHEKCLRKRYEIRWLTPRIFFNFCNCPLCKKWVKVPSECKLAPMIKNNTELYQKIKKMSIERLKFQQLEKDPRIMDPASPYYQKPEDYAVAIYAYFQCFKCKNPYFGGRKNCAQAMNQPQNAGAFKPEQLICPNCCEIPIENCSKHGKDFIEFKCKYCCSTAQWFCWGNTHFCEPCHKRQCNGDYVSKYTKDQLPKCKGPGQCPIGGNHNGNGEERTLGCAICRNYKQNSKNF